MCVCLCVCMCMCMGVWTHRLIFYSDASLSAAHSWHGTAGHSLYMCVCVCVCHHLSLAHTLTWFQHRQSPLIYDVFLIIQLQISMMDVTSSQILITSPPLSVLCVMPAIQSRHSAWTLAHELSLVTQRNEGDSESRAGSEGSVCAVLGCPQWPV